MFVTFLQHPFIKAAKPNSILRALITDAMEIKLKRQEEAEQREQDADDDDNSVQIYDADRKADVSAACIPAYRTTSASLIYLLHCVCVF